MELFTPRYRSILVTDDAEVGLPIHDHAQPDLPLGDLARLRQLLMPAVGDLYRAEGRHMPSGMRLQTPYYATGDPETDEYATLPLAGSTLPPVGMLGQLCDFNRAGLVGPPLIQRYQFVKQAAAITCLVGSVMYWSNKANFVATTARTNRGFLAGIGRIASATAASYIWILKKGSRTVLFQAVTSSAPDATGKPVVCSMTTDGQADCLAQDQAQAAFPLIGTSASVAAAQLASVNVSIPDEY